MPRPDSVFLEELTWIEASDAIAGGKQPSSFRLVAPSGQRSFCEQPPSGWNVTVNS